MKRQSKETRALILISLSMLLLAGGAAKSDNAVETVVIVRHGEKPEKGLGQLSCQGLNRALALPSVIAKTFGRPDAIFAPDPSHRKTDAGEDFDYVRPLATIEPTAIALGLPVNASIGFSDADGLQAAIEQPRYRNALILIAWEHNIITDAARALLAAHGGDLGLVPKWDGNDFDSIYVVTISRTGNTTKATFALKRQGLNRQKDTCPQ
jgi:hypothetical protein